MRDPISIADIRAAQRRITGGIYVSPCPQSIPLSELAGCRIYCKLDYLQRTGSFKERGARNALMLLKPAQRRVGVIAASAGNHALGLAYHGRLLGIPVTVVMPRFAPLIKVSTCRRLEARIILHGDDYSAALSHARRLADEQGLTFIHSFDDPAIIAGQGTLGLEILDQVPQAQVVIVPIGGGGLIAGVALALAARRPGVKLIGVEAANAASYLAALKAGRPVQRPVKPTLADGLAVGKIGQLPLDILANRLDRVVSVTESELALAILRLLELEKSVVEGAGAAPLAACLAGKLPEIAGKHVVLATTGGNIDPSILAGVIDKGLVADGRLFRLTAVISDRPGSLANFASVIASARASFRQITHDRTFSGPDVSEVRVLCTLETSDRDHIRRVHRMLRREGIRFFTHPSHP